MFEIKCKNCGEVNQIHDKMENKTIRCHICKEVIQIGEVKKEVVKNINKKGDVLEGVLGVFMALVICGVYCGVFFNLNMKYPMESGFYLFSKEGREAHRVEVRGNESVSAYNKRIDKKRTPEEREYQEWKKQEDEDRRQKEKEERFRERYER